MVGIYLSLPRFRLFDTPVGLAGLAVFLRPPADFLGFGRPTPLTGFAESVPVDSLAGLKPTSCRRLLLRGVTGGGSKGPGADAALLSSAGGSLGAFGLRARPNVLFPAGFVTLAGRTGESAARVLGRPSCPRQTALPLAFAPLTPVLKLLDGILDLIHSGVYLVHLIAQPVRELREWRECLVVSGLSDRPWLR